jgi:tetratricopeptide (TPR) repeat protein
MIAAAMIIALLLIVEVVRLTVPHALAQKNPDLALSLAPNAPASLAAAAMRQVGLAAAAGANPDQQTFDRLRTLADSAPLETEPFLVEAALADRQGNYPRAIQLLRDAIKRNPRSIAAHFLMADVATRQGNILGALEEVALLSRLVPGTSMQLVPGLSEFAKTPGAREKLAIVLADNPQLKGPLLTALAADADNADLIVSLAGPRGEFNTSTRVWQSRLLGALAARGEYQRAYGLWRHFAGIQQDRQPLLFNGEFANVPAPPPFNWSLANSSVGIAEGRNGKLRVLYYGRQDATLASQLLMLPAGAYRFQAPAAGDMAAGALSWSIGCLGAKVQLLDLRLGIGGPLTGTFTVPETGCPAQKIELVGHRQDSPEDSDVEIGPARIERIRP